MIFLLKQYYFLNLFGETETVRKFAEKMLTAMNLLNCIETAKWSSNEFAEITLNLVIETVMATYNFIMLLFITIQIAIKNNSWPIALRPPHLHVLWPHQAKFLATPLPMSSMRRYKRYVFSKILHTTFMQSRSHFIFIQTFTQEFSWKHSLNHFPLACVDVTMI